jgi:hypothetical protein
MWGKHWLTCIVRVSLGLEGVKEKKGRACWLSPWGFVDREPGYFFS